MDIDRADTDDLWLEQALKSDAQAHAAGYVPDDGFTAKLMARLPTPAVLPAWRRPVIALLWLVAGGAVVALLPDLFYSLFSGIATLLVGQPMLTWSNLAVALIVLGGATWSTLFYAMRAE
jgi:hypothetical protein